MNTDNKTNILIGIGLAAATLLVLIAGTFLMAPFFSSMMTSPTNNNHMVNQEEPSLPPSGDELEGNDRLTVGAKIAQQMEELEDQIVFFWSYNNTWVNLNLSNMYSDFIDGLLAGINQTTNESIIALVHEPSTSSATIDFNQITSIFHDFRTLVKTLSNTTNRDLNSVFPSTFMIDIAYSDNSSISLIFSKEQRVLGVINGTWQYDLYYNWGFDNVHWGVEFPYFMYENTQLVFFNLTDDEVSIINGIIENLQALVTTAIPPTVS